MSLVDGVCLSLVLVLGGYLIVALLKPEFFD